MELYIHIPYCLKKCNYCDFLSFPGCPENASEYLGMEKYVEALCNEIKLLCTEEYSDRKYTSVFIGGGTPSILPVKLMERLLVTVREVLGCDMTNEGFEYTIECNPGTLSAEKLKLYRKYGINRLSIGLQSTDDRTLRILGRIHTYEQFLESYKMAREAGFDNINIDLISAVPEQTESDWEECLRKVAELKPEHISAYSLIIETGTLFWNLYKETCDHDIPKLPDEDAERSMYEATARIVAEYGYERYEISNYSKPGLESKHNLGYWTGEEYLGAGLGASSYVKTEEEHSSKEEQVSKSSSAYVRYKNTDNMQEYISCMLGKDPKAQQCEREILGTEDLMTEYMILHLRLMRGADTKEFQEKFGVSLHDRYGSILEKYERMDLLKEDGERVYLTEKGLNVSNIIMAEF